MKPVHLSDVDPAAGWTVKALACATPGKATATFAHPDGREVTVPVPLCWFMLSAASFADGQQTAQDAMASMLARLGHRLLRDREGNWRIVKADAGPVFGRVTHPPGFWQRIKDRTYRWWCEMPPTKETTDQGAPR
jgi:hypothetical protein